MENKNNDIIKDLIRTVELDEPSFNFTAAVMEEVVASARNEVIIVPALRSVIVRSGFESPSVDFTNSVMTRVLVANARRVNKPIISRKVWWTVGSIVVLVVSWAGLFSSGSASSTGMTSHFVDMGRNMNTILKGVYDIPMLYFFMVVPIGVLSLMDYLLRMRGRSEQPG